MTPLLLAVESGKLDTVQCIVELGGYVAYYNHDNLGVVEIAALKEFYHIVEYFIELNHEELPVWQKLLKMVSVEQDDHAEAAGAILKRLTKRNEEEDKINPNWEPMVANDCVPVLMKVIKSEHKSEKAKIYAFRVILNIIEMQVGNVTKLPPIPYQFSYEYG